MCIIPAPAVYRYISLSQPGAPGGRRMAGAGPQADPVATFLLACKRQRIDVQAVHETLLGKLQELLEVEKDIRSKHVIAFYKKLDSKEKSQQVRVACLACGHSFEATGPTRQVKHLLRCPLMPGDVKKPFKELFDKNESSKVQKRQHDNLVKEEAQHLAAEHAAKQAKLVQQKIGVGLKSLEVAEADLAIAKFFYANGVAFSAASHEQDSYYREMIKKIQAAPAGYLPPGRKKLAGQLLDETHDWMWRRIDERDPDGSRAMRYGSTYVSDGWDSCDNLPLINSAFHIGLKGRF